MAPADLAHVTVAVHAECTDSADFARRVAARSQRVVVGPSADAVPIAITITIDTSASPVVGTMAVQTTSAVRRVEGATCDEVADALGLIVALTFDPETSGDNEPPEPKPTKPTPKPLPPAVLRPPREPRPDDRLRVHTGAHAAAALIDEAPLGTDVFVELGRHTTRTTARLSLSRLTTSVDLNASTPQRIGARFVWTYGALEVCPLGIGGVPSRAKWSASACGGAVMGVLFSESTRGPFTSRSFRRVWVGPRVALRGAFAITDDVRLEAQAALDLPIVRDEFQFGSVRAYQIPLLVPLASVGLNVELP